MSDWSADLMKTFPIFLISLVGLGTSALGEDLYTRSYRAPEILEAMVTTGLEEELNRLGVELVEGSSVTVAKDRTLVLRATLFDHETLEGILEMRRTAGAKQVHIFHEAIEVEKADFGAWLVNHRMHGDADELRDTLQDWIMEGRAQVHHLTALTARSGQRAKTEAAEPYYYPTEFVQPSLPERVVLEGNESAPVVGVQGAVFDRRQVGTTLEVDPMIGTDGVTIDLNLAPEFVALAGESVWPHSESDALRRMTLPTFYVGKVTTQVTLIDGHYTMLGTTVPETPAEGLVDSIFVHLIRADVGRPLGDSGEPVVSEYDPPIPETDDVEGDEMSIQVFRVPASWYSETSAASGITPQSILEGIGVVFPDGASAHFDPDYEKLSVRNTPEQLMLLDAYFGTGGCGGGERQTLIHTEFIEAPRSKVAEWLAGLPTNSEGGIFREEVDRWIGDQSARLLHLAVVVARSGQRAKVESVREYLFGTEFDSGRAPTDITLSDGAIAPVVGATSSAFDARNLGLTLEVDPVLNADGYTIDLILAPEFVELVGQDLFPDPESDPAIRVAQPQFHEMKTATQLTVADGHYAFLGISRPHDPSEGFEDTVVLIFVRADISLGSPN